MLAAGQVGAADAAREEDVPGQHRRGRADAGGRSSGTPGRANITEPSV